MKINMFSIIRHRYPILLAGGFAVILTGTGIPATAAAQDMRERPSLIITKEELPAHVAPTGSVYSSTMYKSGASRQTGNLRDNRSRTGSPDAPYAGGSAGGMTAMPGAASVSEMPIAPMTSSAVARADSGYYQPTETVVGRKVTELRGDLSRLQSQVSSLSGKHRAMKDNARAMASEYNSSLATINTQLQSGTTPGNPRLVEKLNIAQRNLDNMSQSVADLNGMAVEAANAASMGSYLLESIRAAFGLSGAVEEDHAALADLEDQVNNTIVSVDRVLNEVNDDITRTAAYLSAERNNLRTVSLAVTNGDYYGRSLANRPFSSAPPTNLYEPAAGGFTASDTVYPAPANGRGFQQAALNSPRPLVKIKFDRPNVEYEQAVYTAVSEAQQKYPDAQLEVIAVHPSQGNAAQVAIESTRSRRNAEMVLRSLQQMGINVGNVALSTTQSAEAATSEVHLYIR